MQHLKRQLSPNFRLSELIKSDIASRNDITEQFHPDDKIVHNLWYVANKILQPVRDHFGKPIVPSSGWRCLRVNRLCPSRDTSDHIKGFAVDFEIHSLDNLSVARWIRDNLVYRQLILEFYNGTDPSSGWVHCSYNPDDLKMENLIINHSGTTYWNE